jgi:diacylglycerol kinase family enzyme
VLAVTEPSLTGTVRPASAAARRVIAVINAAGGTAAAMAGKLESDLEAAFAAAGITADFVIPSAGGDIAASIGEAADRIKAGEADILAVGGGDGTLRTAAAAIAGTGIPLAVLPLGTRNHFARDIGVPIDLPEAIRLLAEGEIRAVDVGEVNGEVFINNSSIGLYPFLVADRERRQAAGMRKPTAMLLALFRGLVRFPRRRLRINTGSEVVERRTPVLFVGNNAYDMNFLSLGRKHVDSGMLYVYVARSRSAVQLIWFALRAGFGAARRQRDFDLIEVPSFRIRARSTRLPVALDGEALMLTTPLEYRSRPGALAVLVPRAG